MELATHYGSPERHRLNFGLFSQMYDNFTLGQNTTLQSVHFEGEYFNPPTQGPITGWTVSLYEVMLLGSRAAFCSLSTPPELGTRRSTARSAVSRLTPTSLSLPDWAVNSGTQYWLSVYPDLAFPPQWGWSSGTGGDGISYQDFFGARSQIGADMAFALDGTTQSGVPEPGTLVMLGTGVLGLAGVIRRKLF